ncbi:MAG: DUF1501 domain-containing protein [Planctomycetaceae bacterium]|nr:DUF1501 domain-containing protein [Planctomycetaceae bacterium]
MRQTQTCDGVTRRDAVKVGVLGATGLTLSGILRAEAFAAAEGKVLPGKATSAIFINLTGGPSHMDTFDLKPNAPAEYRGEFNPITTNVPGIEISEHLPKLAQCADKFSILRGVSHTLAAHALGQEYVISGNRPLPSLQYPSIGSVVAKELTAPTDLPPFVAVPRTNMAGGFLGVKYNPLNTAATPRIGQRFTVRGVSIDSENALNEARRREKLLGSLDVTFKGYEQSSQLIEGLDEFGQKAFDVMTSPTAKRAFDISQESDSFSEKFGETPLGGSALLALRLVEAGTRFVTLTYGGWDTHNTNWERLKDRQLPPLDQALSALLTGLEERGLLETTAVFVTGEFGRTPKINNRDPSPGRDHYPRCMFMLLAGGGIQGGQVIGESDDKATGPLNDAITPDDAAASLYQSLGINYEKEYHTATGRPIMIVRNGTPIPQLFS